MAYIHYNKKKTGESGNIYYEDQGAGRPLILLPGNTASSAVHQGEIEYFTGLSDVSFRVICPDYPGYGRSDRGFTYGANFFRENGELIVFLIQELNLESPLLFGTSGGGMIALNAAILLKDQVRAVVADSISGPRIGLSEIEAEVRNRNFADEGAAGFWAHCHGEDWRQVVEMDSRALLEAAGSGGDLYEGGLGEIQCPVLLTGSRKDELIPGLAEKMDSMARMIPESRQYLFDSGGHPTLWSQSDQVRALALDFFKHHITS